VIRTHDAIVLRPAPFQEGGLVLSFLTDRGERLAGIAKGAKKPSAKWVAAFEPLSLVRVSLFGREHSDVRRVTRCDLLHSPMTLGRLDSNLVIACLADLVDRIAKEGIEDPRLFRLVSGCSRELRASPERAHAILAYGEHWLLHCMGLLPSARACGNCGNADAPFVLLDECGWRCSACTPADASETLPAGAKEYLRWAKSSKVEESPGAGLREASAAVTQLLRSRLSGEVGHPRSYDILSKAMGGSGPSLGA
jgi:DNA repair protein RecO